MTEAYLPPIPDPVITAPASPRIATDPEGRGRRRANGRGLNAFVVVKPNADPFPELGPVEKIVPDAPEPAAEGATEAPAPMVTFLPEPAVPEAPAPAVDPVLIGQAVAEAVANAVAAQTDLADRYLFAARRIDELEGELRALAREREADVQAFGERIRTMEAEREAVMVDLVARLHHLEAERDHLAEELRGERARGLVEAAEVLADVLTPRLCGVLDEHTGLADRYAAAAQRVGELEATVARLADQVNGARAWRTEFEQLERAAARPWWKFWG